MKSIRRNNRQSGSLLSGSALLLPKSITPPVWTQPFLPFLGIRDFGDERIEEVSDHWGPWEPPTAGAFIHRSVLNEYLNQTSVSCDAFRLGRTPKRPLSCEDSHLMRCAIAVGRSSAYEPSLVLQHHLASHRFRFRYLLRLMYCYGVSHALLEFLLKGPQPIPAIYGTRTAFFKLLVWTFKLERSKPVQFIASKVAYHFGARRQYHLQHLKKAE